MEGRNYLKIEDKEELDLLYKELNKIKDKNENNVKVVSDKKLKKRVAKFCLKLVNEAGDHEKSIQETAYTIAGFMQFLFNDKLDEVASIAGELELPKSHVSGDVFKMFDKMKKMLEKYPDV